MPRTRGRVARAISAPLLLASLAIGVLAIAPAAGADPLQIGQTGERAGDSITLHAVGEGSIFCSPRPELTVAFPPCAVGEGMISIDPPRKLIDITYCVESENTAVQPLEPDGAGIDDLFLGDIDGVATGLGDGFQWRFPGEGIAQNSLSEAIAPGTCARGFLPFGVLSAKHLIWGVPRDEAVIWQIGGQLPSVIPIPTPPTPTPAAATAVPATVDPAPSSGPDNGTDVQPGVFSRSVPEPAAINADPLIVAQSALLALAVIFLMPFPAQLFNSTLEEHADEVRSWFSPLIGAARGLGRGLGAFWRTPIGIGAFLLLSATLYALLDPGFGLSAETAVTLVGLGVGIVLVTLVFGIPLIIAHRRHGERPAIQALPGTLLMAAACVLVSRLADFQPGYLYGLVIGFAFASELEPAEEGRTGALAAILMLGAAGIAWTGLGLVRGAGVEGFGPTVAETVLAAIMVAGLEGVVFGLLPLRFLPGEPVFRWNRVVWGALLGIGLFAFFHILINPVSGYLSDTSRTPLFTFIGLLIGFGLVSVAFWGYFRFRRARPASAR